MDDLIILEPTFSGATFYGTEIELFEVVDTVETPVDLTGVDAIMQLRNSLGAVVFTYRTSDGSLQVEGNKIIIPEHKVSVGYGHYVFDFNLLLVSGGVMAGFGAGSWEILKPKTTRP